MVNFKKLGQQAKDLVDKRGGTDALKEDAGEVRDIAKGTGSLTDKAKAAAAALKDPGADGTRTEPAADAAENRVEAAADENRAEAASEKPPAPPAGGSGQDGV